MSEHRVLITGGQIVTESGPIDADILIQGGKIQSISTHEAHVDADEIIDATGLIVTPGGIDTHTHVHWPYSDKFTQDDFYSATVAAVLGGTTSIIDFVPPTAGDLRENCWNRADEATGKSVIDFGFHPILVADNSSTMRSIPEVISDGFYSFKMYTTYEDRRIDDGAAWQLMNAIASNGGLPGFHAENHEFLESVGEGQQNRGQITIADYPESRPALAEAETIQMVGLYARKLGTPVYIFHVSGAEALSAVTSCREAGATVYAETCTHYLTFDDSVYSSEGGWKYVIAPPIRTEKDRLALWKGIADGSIDSVGSDHCAYAAVEKQSGMDDYRSVPAGAPGIEARGPLLLAGFMDQGLSWASFVAANAARAARCLGLYPQKGTLLPGSDADLVLWDSSAEWSGHSAITASTASFSMYDDVQSRGRPRHVIVGGQTVVRDSAFVGSPGGGKFLVRGFAGSL